MNKNRDKNKAQGDTEDEITEIVAQKNVINVEEEIAGPKADLKLSPEKVLLYNGLDDAGKVMFLDILRRLEEEKKEGREEGREEGRKEERKRGIFYVNLVISLEGSYSTILIKNINHNCCCADQCA
ncbi:uncharacterized protein OCT59_014305 [Rhizophagus irregularis]|uniref:Uncharacterized protein n=1 Tax=Rhizophagus irregularis (strain DAOM 181602 / DAOM 197198 / MUCL 43194) TaxID=747089 RepID=A0A2P4PS37_RHIID|nr:hypothetical protein GLOIN_2v1481043 [Rhizophagus irregularis DAOM 181602=DAOM 197198]POG68204.1 hypothetical protein GLOIN_2v1481043 [Rhizophagus irregularis DAOM 181602=DAOM 197198]UZO21923.1 hypothetical protein OCT59_014305 [Rhizophagus irregularis]|eukprot:XP_025175070.1 hypothetical protein GLOIN_2v1481043 [Rhizophagus irregularis DAOM 181602=DAOM 197198]